MFARILFARSSPLRLSAASTTRLYSRSLSTLRLTRSARSAVSPCANLRQFSVAPALRTEDRDNTRTSHPPSGKCFIANLPYKVTAEQLKDAFSEFGKVSYVKILTTDTGLPRGIGFVQFESVADAVNFVEAHSTDPIYVLDRQLSVEHAQAGRNVSGPSEPCDTLVVPRFQGDSDVGVRAMFGKFADNILAVRFDKKEAGQPARNAYVQFRNVDVAMEAMEVFRRRNEEAQIRYARQTQTNSSTLTSRLSQHRGH